MENLITVISLQGKAWAVAQDGSRRELQVGDTVAADEMVVTATGAQIDLQFADNQVLTLVGEQDAPVDVAQLAKKAELSQPLTPINSAKEDTSSAITVDDTLESEGHRFVQLVRIHEIIESDGFTPLTVARIQEIIKPLGMVLPERDFEQDRWKDNYSRNEHQSVDRTPPELQGGELEALKNLDADMINLDLSSRFKDAVSGSDITYVAENLPKGLTINPKTGVISGKIDSSASQGGNTGTKGDYKVTIIVTDPAGNSSEHDFVWTVTNPPPVATDDRQTIDEDTVATGNVIKGTNSSNSGGGADNDPDGDELKVTEFTIVGDSTVYPAGTTVTIPNIGDLTLNESGDYTFEPVQDWNGTVPDVNYTISDGEGGYDDAVLKITVTPVNDAPVAIPPATPLDQVDVDADSASVTLELKELFKDVDNTHDELTYTVTGLPPGLSFDPDTGVISGTIDRSASQGGSNNDGVYSVTVTATDPGGLSADQTFTWTVTNPDPEAEDDVGETLKSERLTKDAAIGVLENDSDPDGDPLSVQDVTYGDKTVTENDDGELVIDGEYGTLVLKPNGSYVYTPDLTNDTVWQLPENDQLTDSFTYTVSDGEGGTAEANLVITIKGHSNTPPFLTPGDHNDEGDLAVNGHITVHEKGLDEGTDPGQGHTAEGEIKISAMDGLASITIAGEEYTLAQLLDLDNNPIEIAVDGGKLTLTGFDPLKATILGVDKVRGGDLKYTYELTADQKHDDGDGNNSLTLDIQLAVKDDQGADSSLADHKLIVNVIDDVPTAKPDTAEITEDAADNTVSGNVVTNDIKGADGVTVTGVVKGTDTTELSSNTGNNVSGDFGTLKLNANGSYSYELDNSNPIVNALKTGEPLTDTFSYTIKDADGDWSTTTVTITINGRTDGNPTIVPEDKNGADPSGLLTAGQVTVYESGLTTDGPSGQSETAGGEITVQALDGLVSVSVAGQTFDLDALASLSTTNVAINTEYGILTLNGFTPVLVDGIIVGGELTYSYELTKPFNNTEPGEEGDQNGLDTLDLKVVDAGNAESNGTLDINIIDDAPSIGTPDNQTVGESALPGGSSENPANVTVTGNLDVRVGADSAAGGGSAAKVSFATEQTDLKALNLSSGYDASDKPILVEYVVTDSVVTAYKGAGRDEADKVFTVTITNPGSNAAGYEFTLHKPLNHGTETKLDLPFDFAVIDGDNDPANKKFTITVTDDAPTESSGEYILDIVEDSITTTSENSFNTSADANPGNTVISVTGDVALDVVDDGKGGKTYTYPATHTDSQDFYGSVTVNANGSITYVPDKNYSNPGSPDSFTYTTTNGTDVDTVEVTVNVKPVADAPDLEADKVLITPEDTLRSLELETPVVTDKIQVPGATATTDYPERLGEITLTLTGTAIGTLTKDDGSTAYKNTGVDGIYKFVITDVANLHLDGLTSAADPMVNYVTQAEYEAIKALPAEDRHENFDVKVSVDSYEVDASGAPQGGIASANNTQTITVDVNAVTDKVSLEVKAGAAPADVIIDISADSKTANITFNEDTSFNLTNILDPAPFKDLDGSETRYLQLEGLPVGTIITVGTDEYTVNATDVPLLTLPGTQTALPVITITPPKDFSGDLNNITVTLGAQDSDADSKDNDNFEAPVLETDSVTINLYVKPVGGDAKVEGVTGDEDTAIAFLKGIEVTDTGTGSEVITKVIFTVPDDWTVSLDGATWTNADGKVWKVDIPTTGVTVGVAGNTYTITGADLEAVLKDFTVTPPAHGSANIVLENVQVTTKDTNTVGEDTVVGEGTTESTTLEIDVKPVGEKIAGSYDADGNWVPGSEGGDTDGNSEPDLKMGGDHVYQTTGEEDEPFDLGVDDTFKLSAGWSNEDGKWVRTSEDWAENTDNGRSEDTFALLTPFKTVGNSAMEDATTDGKLEGSVFTYSDGTTTFTLPFAGEPVKIPMQYLDSVTFTGPKDWAGVVKIKVQAGTVDYDEDAPNTATGMTISGEAWLTNLVIAPKADQVTLKVDTPIKTLEDTPVELNIVPTSSDKNETFDVTISGIPVGATIEYWSINESGDSVEGTFISSAGNTTLEITNFDKTNQPKLTPPKDSNEPINLTVKAESVDTLTYIDKNGASQTVTHKDPSKAQELPINVEVQGVPDTPNVTIKNDMEYWEDGVEDSSAQGAATGLKVALKDLVTSMESGEIKNTDDGNSGLTDDGSETITLRISDLPEGFTLTGAGPQLGAGSGTERVWVISKADLDKVQIVVPEHYSGTVKFTVQPVVTENDNPSEVFFEKQNVSFKVKPVAEASLSVSSDLLEDIIDTLSLEAIGADTDEYISAVTIKAADLSVEIEGVTYQLTLHDSDGYKLDPDTDGNYIFNYDGAIDNQTAPAVYIKGPANFSGELKLDIGYTVTDPVADGTIDPATKDGTVTHTLNFAPVTDKIDLSLGSVNGEVIADGDVTTQTDPGTIKVKLNIEQKADLNADASVNDGKDTDGSEQLTHIVITGVPAGVSVAGAVETASGQWLITITGEQWNGNAILEHELEFVVSGYAAPFTGQTVTITTYSKDTGAANYEKDSVEWKLTYERADEEEENDLPNVSLDALDNLVEQEDGPFSLDTVVTGEIDAATAGTSDYNVTLTIRTKEGDDTTFDGMAATQVVENGETITLWTKTEKVNTGESGQAKLEEMLGEITVKTPKDANSNNLPGGKLELDINLSVHADGISRDDSAKPEVVITPVTDDITVAVSTNVAGEGEDVALNITLPADTVDGKLGAAAGWTIVDGKVYIHVADDGTGLKGQLTDADGNALEEHIGVGPAGTPASGKLYAVDVDKVGGLKFVPDAGERHQTGKLDITVLVNNQEIGASNVVVSTGTGSVEIQQSNSGYKATISAVGEELQGKPDDELIKLNITDQGLVDDKETIDSAFISGLPDGFTVWVGESATMASNAGSGTWAIPLDGNDLPTNISIKPPKNWSGTLEGLKLTVMSGHAGLTPTASDISFDLVVNPVANGIEMNPTLSFGDAGDKIELNLNASMKDPSAATGAKDEEGKLTDQYTELTELSLSGFPDGQKVQFFIGDSEVPLDGSQATFDGSTWTITGLSQSDLQNLKFLHGEGSADITVKGRTYEVNAAGEQYKESEVPQYSDWSDAKTAAINISPTVPTSRADHFLWDGKAINGFGGEDTVQLRFGDKLSTTDFSKMENIEIIDMSGAASGANSITGLTPEDVFNMTDDDNLLKIIADKSDTVDLGSSWGAGATKDGKTTYSYTDPDSSIKINLEVTLID